MVQIRFADSFGLGIPAMFPDEENYILVRIFRKYLLSPYTTIIAQQPYYTNTKKNTFVLFQQFPKLSAIADIGLSIKATF